MNKRNLMFSVGVLSALVLSGCGSSSSDDNGGGTVTLIGKTVTLDATNATSAAKMNLANGTTVSDSSWHIAYQKYVGFKSNGGTSGDGNVSVCLAKKYDDLFDTDKKSVQASFEALTASNTIEAFNAVSKTDCNTSAYKTDDIISQFKDWYTYNGQTHVITVHTDKSNAWMISTKDGNTTDYARMKVTSFSGGITFDVQKWDANNSQFSTAVSTGNLVYSGGVVYYNFTDNNNSTTQMTGWDLKIEKDGYGHKILLNSNTKVGAVLAAAGEDPYQVTDPASTTQVYKYFNDSADSTLKTPGTYGALQYAVAGGHKMWPTFAVYIFKDGSNYYKAQVVSNYGESGSLASGNLFIRYKKLD